MPKTDAEIERLESRCDGLEAALECVITAIIGHRPDDPDRPNYPAFLEDQFREMAKNSQENGSGPPAVELLERFAEWMARAKDDDARGRALRKG